MAYKSWKPKNNNYIDSTGISHNREILSSLLNNINSNISSLVSDVTRIDGVLNSGIKYGIFMGGELTYSASGWSRPRIKYNNFNTNDSSIFESYSNNGIKVKSSGSYLAILSRETNLGTNEQDCFLTLGSNIIRFTCYSANANFFAVDGLSSGNIVYGDTNTNSSSFKTNYSCLILIKLS